MLQVITDAIDALASRPVLLAIITLIIGFVTSVARRLIADRLEQRKAYRDNLNIRLDGDDWVAIWQAAADGEVILNSEDISMSQRGDRVLMKNAQISPENPKGGYLWDADLRFTQGENLMGWYYPRKGQNICQRGIMFLCYDASRKLFLGRWAGKAIDGPLANGFVAIAKSKDLAETAMNRLIAEARKHPVNVISSEFSKF